MSGQEALDAMRAIVKRGGHDPEVDHDDADEVLCLLLRSLGFNALVDAWDDVPKWYA